MSQIVLQWQTQLPLVERLPLLSLRAEELHCAPEHRELLSAAKLPSDIINICPPLTFFL